MSKNVAATARSMPAAAIRFPFTAVFGPDRPFRPSTNVIAAIR